MQYYVVEGTDPTGFAGPAGMSWGFSFNGNETPNFEFTPATPTMSQRSAQPRAPAGTDASSTTMSAEDNWNSSENDNNNEPRTFPQPPPFLIELLTSAFHDPGRPQHHPPPNPWRTGNVDPSNPGTDVTATAFMDMLRQFLLPPGANIGDYAWDQQDLDDIITRLLDEHVQTEHPESENVLNDLPTEPFVANPQMTEPFECPICRSEVQDGEILVLLPCQHRFHPECIKAWLKVKDVCAICRMKIDQATLDKSRNTSSKQTDEQQNTKSDIDSDPNAEPHDKQQ